MINMMAVMEKLKGMQNPQQMIVKMMQDQAGNNPVAGNAVEMMNAKNYSGLEELARNIGKQKGVDVDAMMKQIRNGMGM